MARKTSPRAPAPRSGPPRSPQSAAPLSEARILRCAIALADESGIEALSMRKIASQLGVEAMSLYNHVANKDTILDGIVDVVIGEIYVPDPARGWRSETRKRAISAREVLVRHPWAPVLIESRSALSAVRLRYAEAMLGTLRRGGFDIGGAYNALLLIDSYVYGFTLQEISWPHAPSELPEVVAALTPQIDAEALPHMAEMMTFVMRPRDPHERLAPAYQAEFEQGLDLVLDGLERSKRKR